MDPNPNNYPILNYVMDKLPSIKQRFSATTPPDHDVENPLSPPKCTEPVFELSEKMPHLKNPSLLSSMRAAVSDVSKTRSVLQTLGTRPDHETVDAARLRIAEIDAAGEAALDEEKLDDYKVFKAVIRLEEMFESYEKLLSDAEKRLERIYEAALNGEDVDEVDLKGKGVVEEMMNVDVVRILEEAESGKEVKTVDLEGKGLTIFPEVFGKFRSFVVLNLADNQLQVIPDSIAGLINLEELYLSTNFLEALPDSIGLLFKLKILDVSRNKLAALPDSICQCRSLIELDASFNKLTYLPTNIGFELVNLQKLSIHLNKIRSLPSSIGDLKSLRLLDVHFNELNGLPNSIGKLTKLEILNLGSNFSDLKELPETITDLTSLKDLDLSNNQIHALPDTFGRLVSLNKLNLDENPLEIPPKNVLAEGVEAVRAYMVKRQADMEEELKNGTEVYEQAQAGLLTRSTSWLSSVVSSVSGSVSGYVGGAGKPNDDSYLNQQL